MEAPRRACNAKFKARGDVGRFRYCRLPAGHAPELRKGEDGQVGHDDGEGCGAPGPGGPCIRLAPHGGDHAGPTGSVWRGLPFPRSEARDERDDAGPVVLADGVTRTALADLLAAAHRQLDACATLAGALADDGQEPSGAALSDRLASLAGAVADEGQLVTLHAAREARLAAEGFGKAVAP